MNRWPQDRPSAKEILAALWQYEADTEFLARHRAAWLKIYPDSWVVVYKEALICQVSGPGLETLELALSMAEAQGVPRGRTVVDYLNTNPLPLMLLYYPAYDVNLRKRMDRVCVICETPILTDRIRLHPGIKTCSTVCGEANRKAQAQRYKKRQAGRARTVVDPQQKAPRDETPEAGYNRLLENIFYGGRV